ncbi:MAG: HIT domain-containing protein [Saprospiraceae bacterium]|nr:HIT domain-containing protein [Saprospiraceae bacterium]
MASIFTRIINGELPCYKIAESQDYFAFLDIAPVERGHTLVIPKKEVDYVFDLDDETYMGLHLFAKRVAHAIEAVVPCERVGMTVLGLEVPHAHVHLVPLVNSTFINFAKDKLNLEPEQMATLASKISAAFV